MVTSNYMPIVTTEIAFNAGYNTPAASRTWTDVSDYVELAEGIDITRGRSDEFATCDPNHLKLTLDNRDGRFTAGKTGGAYYPNVKIGRPIRVSTTLAGINYVSNSTFETDAAGWSTIGGGSVAQSAVRAQEGTKSLLVTWPTVAIGNCNAVILVGGLIVGLQYTASMYVWVPVGAPRVYALAYFVAVGSPTTTTGAWERISVTFTATATNHSIGVGNADAATAGQQCWVDAVMVTQGTTVGTFTSAALGRGNYVTNSTLEADATYWESNTVYGTYAVAAWARSTTRANSGVASLLATWPTAAGATWVNTWVSGLTIGATYTASAYVWVPPGSPDPKMEVAFGATGVATATKSAWTRITVTFVAANTMHSVGVRADATTAGQQCWLDDIMVNEGSAAVDFTSTPPASNYRFVGYVDEWPVEWEDTDAYAKAEITASSRMARLGFNAELRSAIAEEILADAPYAYYPMSEESGASTAGNASTTPQGVMVQSGEGATGDVSFGSSMGAGALEISGAGFSGGVTKYLYVTMPYGATNSTIECFAAFTGTLASTIMQLGDDNAGQVYTDATGHVVWQINGSGGTTAGTYNDGRVHHYALTGLTAGSGTFYVDGVSQGGGMAAVSGGTGGLRVGSTLLEGTIAHLAYHQSALSAARILAHATAGLTGYAGETAAQRIARYAAQVGIPAIEVAASSDTQPVGAINTDGKTALDAMRVVETTENGVLFDARDNTLTLSSRASRYNIPPALTLDVAAGEVGAGIVPKLDRSVLINDVTATASDGSIARAINQTSIDAYGYARQSIELASSNNEAFQLGAWLVSNYGEPTARIPALELDLLNAGLSLARQSALMAADVGTKITLSNMPIQAPSTSADFFIEGYTESIGPESYTFSLNVSPVPASFFAYVWTIEDPVYGQYDLYPIAL